MDKKSFFLVVLGLCCISMGAYAQDTTKRKSIDITSSFKPVLRDAVKINFNAAPPALDTSRPRLSYTIPAQYLFLNYQPGEMKPVALQRDSMNPWTNYNYIKIGAGNIHIPYVRTGFSFGDGKTSFINLFANELNSKGSLPYQKNGMTDLKLIGTFKTPNNLEWNAGVGYKYDIYYLYGFQPDTLKFNADQLRQTFSTVDANISLRNTVATEFGLLYHPNFKTSYFTDNHNPKGNEVNTVLNLPLEKLIGKEFAFDLGVTADLTHYNLPSAPSGQNNNIYYVNPAFLVKTQNLYLHAGVTPSWDNKVFHLLPNFLADISTSDQKFTVQAGFIGYYDKGSYQRFESINPWLAQPDSLQNTRMQEIYGGFKGSIGSHFAYAAKVGILTYKNMPLFINDYANAGKDFVIQYASSMQAAQFHGEVSYLQGDVLEVTGSINGLQFHDLKNAAQPWGLTPVEFNAHFKWQAFKDFWAKADLYTFQGAEYLASDGSSHRGDRGTDMNAGVEFRITHQLNLWFQMNNIFNNKYQRWNQYQVYGFNVLGGIVFSFGGK
ncbi:MAG TPA: hypothetical protein VHW43_02665 [Puia sp.]|nr:hypothetical protein [Puia sp.]